MNSQVGIIKINLPHIWDCFDETDKDNDDQSGNKVSKYFKCNAEGRKVIEFCERNMLEILNGKYGEDTKGEHTFVYQLGKSVTDNALMPEGMLRDLVDFRIGMEIISSHMPLTITIRNILHLEESRDLTVVAQTQKLSTYKWRESLKLDFMDTLNDNSTVLCIHAIQSLLQRDEVNNVVNILYFMVKRAGAKMRQSGGNHREN
jgi:hypothetical protein